jgi:hypothetical protein
MTEIYRLTKVTFDTLENNIDSAISEQHIGNYSSHDALSEALRRETDIELYLGWDGNVYPQYKVRKETLI